MMPFISQNHGIGMSTKKVLRVVSYYQDRTLRTMNVKVAGTSTPSLAVRRKQWPRRHVVMTVKYKDSVGRDEGPKRRKPNNNIMGTHGRRVGNSITLMLGYK
jgi:hypothetical protein